MSKADNLQLSFKTLEITSPLTQILNAFPGSMPPDPGLLGWAAFGGHLSKPPSQTFGSASEKGSCLYR